MSVLQSRSHMITAPLFHKLLMLHACQSQAKCSICLMQMWKGLEGDTQEALRQAAQQLSDVEEAQQEAARLWWTADTAQRCSSHTKAK